MKAVTVRSGLVESAHEWTAVLVANDAVQRTWGEGFARMQFARSTIKPFQATISQTLGADLAPEQMAVACASHSATPAQVALVADLLETADFLVDDLRCPPSLPHGEHSRRRWLAAGRSEQRIAHNCSGKHAAFLRACRSQGWDHTTYLDPLHPLQRRVLETVGELTGERPTPVGVDGCGAPTPRLSLAGLARAFAKLSSTTEFVEAATAMARYPALTASNTRADGRLAMWWAGPVKIGAEGLIAIGRAGWGLAAKS